MSRVNIEQQAFTDVRFGQLAIRLQLADADHARGKMARVWLECTNREKDTLSEIDISLCFDGESKAAVALIECDLAERVDGGVRIKGCVGRTDWLRKKREAGRIHGKKGGRPRKGDRKGKKRVTLSDNKGSPRQKITPPAPAPAPAPADNPQTPKGDVEIVVEYLNKTLGRTGSACYQPKGKTRELIEARLAEGHTEKELRMVCWAKHQDWAGKEEMAQFLRPSTLFRKSKFDEYLPDAQAAVAAQERCRPDPHKVSREDYKPLLENIR